MSERAKEFIRSNKSGAEFEWLHERIAALEAQLADAQQRHVVVEREASMWAERAETAEKEWRRLRRECLDLRAARELAEAQVVLSNLVNSLAWAHTTLKFDHGVDSAVVSSSLEIYRAHVERARIPQPGDEP